MIFCTGSSGLVASHFKQTSQKAGIDFVGFDLGGEKTPVNILDQDSLKRALEANVKNHKPEDCTLFHFAAGTVTGKNITPEQEKFMVSLNVEGTKNVLHACRQFAIPVVHISTDFVFAGANKRTPYLPTDEMKADDTIYSQTKVQAEMEVLTQENEQMVNIVRIAFPYGNLSHPKPDLLKKMLNWMDEKAEVNLYGDQDICPAPVEFISKACLKIHELVKNKEILSGIILHVVGQPTTPYDFGSLIKEIFGKTAQLNKTSVKGTGTMNLVLDTKDTEKYIGFSCPSHEEMLRGVKG